MERLAVLTFLGVIILASLTNTVLSKRLKREAEVPDDLHVGKSLQRTKRLNLASEGKSLSRVKRLDTDQELKRYKRQKRHVELIKEALAHIKKRSITPHELKELMRVKRTKRHATQSRVKREKSRNNKLHKREKKSLKKRTLTKRDIELAKALLRKKRKEHRPTENLTSGHQRVRTVKKDGKQGHAQQKKHHVQRHKKSTSQIGETKKHKKSQHSKKSASLNHKKSAKELSRVKRQ